MAEQLAGGEIDVLTGDYLAELTMLILGRDRLKDPKLGYAKTFLRHLESTLGTALDRGVKIVANAGGLNPAGLAAAVRVLADNLGLEVAVAHVEGDDLRARAAELGLGEPLAANAYLGAWGIADCLTSGADVVVTGRVTDASLVVGPAAAHFGWARDDHNALAGAVVAGHVIECGPQATGGNYAFFRELPGAGQAARLPNRRNARRRLVGDHQASGDGRRGHRRHRHRSVAVRDRRRALCRAGRDRPLRHRRAVRRRSGPGADQRRAGRAAAVHPEGRAEHARRFPQRGDVRAHRHGHRGQGATGRRSQLSSLDATWTLARTDHPDAAVQEEAAALLHCVVRGTDPKALGRAFSGAAIELALASYPGFHVTAPPGEASPYGVFSAASVPATEVPHVAVHDDGTRVEIAPSTQTRELDEVPDPETTAPPSGPTRRVPLGTVVGARSGDKGGSANVGIWARSDDAFAWLASFLTVDEFRRLLPETAALPVARHVLPNLRALNFVVEDVLGQGVASNARHDPQAKAIGEWLRSRAVDIPESLL